MALLGYSAWISKYMTRGHSEFNDQEKFHRTSFRHYLGCIQITVRGFLVKKRIDPIHLPLHLEGKREVHFRRVVSAAGALRRLTKNSATLLLNNFHRGYCLVSCYKVS